MEWWRRIRWVLLYGLFYMISFYAIENRSTQLHILHTKVDDLIPFCEYFIIPYMLWFVFVAVTIIYFAFINKNAEEYYSLIFNLGIGMTLFIIISWIWPNGHDLRPEIIEDDIFHRGVRMLYGVDTSTNIFPSIHVFNSVACCIAWMKNKSCQSHRVLLGIISCLTVLIILSTVLLKQHSILDIIGALIMNIMIYPLVYSKRMIEYMKSKKASWCRRTTDL